MADKEEGGEAVSRGNEWEVVSLTASTYAAAPGPPRVSLEDDNAKGSHVEEEEAETSYAMFLSSHFVFPPSEHENLPVEPVPDSMHIHQKNGDKLVVPDSNEDEMKFDGEAEEEWDIGRLAEQREFPGIVIFDEKGNELLIHDTECGEGTGFEGSSFVEKEKNVYAAAQHGSFQIKRFVGGSPTFDSKTLISDLIDPSQHGLDLAGSQSPNSTKDDTYDGSDLPCEAWWKRRVASLYAHTKEANSFWSICVAAAVMGLVIIGQQWQQERWRVLHLKWQISAGDTKIGRMLSPLTRLKDALVGGHRSGSSIGTSGSGDR